MVRIKPSAVSVDEVELNRQLRHACPRIKRWKSRIDEADGDPQRMREQAICKSPVYVAIQKGSRNIQIRTRTKPKWWRKWIQEAKKYDFDDSYATPIHIPTEVYRHQRQVSFSSSQPSSSHSSPSHRRSIPVSPVKTGIHSPIKVSVLKSEQFYRSPTKRSPNNRGVPLLTLTPVPLNQVLKKKARTIGLVSSIGKGRWIEQDGGLLSVPGKQVFQYDSASDTEDERLAKGGEILSKLIGPGSPTVAAKRLMSAKQRREEAPKSPKRTLSPKIGGQEVSEEESESDSHLSPTTRRLRSKIRAAGQTSLIFSPDRRSVKNSVLVEESEGTTDPEDTTAAGHQSARARSAALKKIRATGQVRAALSPHKSPSRKSGHQEVEAEERTPKTPAYMKKKIRAIGKTSAALSPSKRDSILATTDTDNEGGLDGSRGGGDKSLCDFIFDLYFIIVVVVVIDISYTESSGIGSIFRKIKTIARLSSTTNAPDASN
ncbi:uncharacterized protein LOC128954111 [Oppia nitens]|uniref:uncharacterized protein LOC128954111 n=1 Tax=Oppia nitens TaxID=1686743 RepID=UPI0023DB55F9|nr:uncharacterized protein LOC128954111 [Oppia nitens]